MIQIFMISDYLLVARMIEKVKYNSSTSDVSGFRCIVMVLGVIVINVQCQKRWFLTDKLSEILCTCCAIRIYAKQRWRCFMLIRL